MREISLQEAFASFADQPVVVLGSSPELNNVDLSLLKGVRVIAVNNALDAYPDADVLVFRNMAVPHTCQAFADYTGPVCTVQSNKSDIVGVDKDVAFFGVGAKMGVARDGAAGLGDPLGYSVNTVLFAAQLAALAGSSVGFLGVDYNAKSLQKKGRHTHFYGYCYSGFFCTACNSSVSEKKVEWVDDRPSCPRCGVIGRLIPSSFSGGGGWDSSTQKNVEEIYRWSKGVQEVPMFNLSPNKASSLKKTSMPRMTLKDFCSVGAPTP